jgi:hypothetical protein
MDAAAAAAMSDPERNPLFRRRWIDAGKPAVESGTAAQPDPDRDLAATGIELLEQWRRDRVATAENVTCRGAPAPVSVT